MLEPERVAGVGAKAVHYPAGAALKRLLQHKAVNRKADTDPSRLRLCRAVTVQAESCLQIDQMDDAVGHAALEWA